MYSNGNSMLAVPVLSTEKLREIARRLLRNAFRRRDRYREIPIEQPLGLLVKVGKSVATR